MKWIVMYSLMAYLISCADNDGDDSHSQIQRILRAIVWPATLHSFLISQNAKLYRLLTSLWIMLTAGWVLSLLADRIKV